MTLNITKRIPDKLGKKIVLLLFLAVGSVCLFVFMGMRGIEGDAHVSAEPSAISAQTMEERVDFLTDYTEARELALRQGKPVILFFMDENCPFSHRAINETFADREVVELSRDFVCVAIDISRRDMAPIIKEYAVTGSPTVQFVSARGDKLQQVAQLVSAAEFKKEMESVLYTVAWRQPSSFVR